MLRNLYDLVIANAEDLATILTMEMGKPLNGGEGRDSLRPSYSSGWRGGEACLRRHDPGHQPDKRIIVLKQPIGSCGDHAVEFSECECSPETGAAAAAGLRSGFEACRETPLSRWR